ncbi:hypothetical protein SDRG_14859 [Saprolegnia diclina VS20]|uniref:HSF-type DNA-binding domain-containing protein n=1 Tax=Saprolegnia diclina (strain VS20) TaxID=1156394 RepID=T0Q1R8_SAPDV|nr:hypothetical protein SDRG_14859 [Saprolegnia diclina VS20]EQC27335.1 hypothetical protein SDRG_14859 [Saprolegnia diclina VS20]|eukprot:XP_008619239.1 hypothetical protein SDRG_14859 [Saprolegnia diclina VS20]
MASSSVFLQKTYSMLSQSPPSVLSWSSAGDAFLVYDVKTLEGSLLSRYFNHNNFASFSRQLRFYGFEKTRFRQRKRDEAQFSFQHPHFRRDAPEAMKAIRRKTYHIADDGVSKSEVDDLRVTMDRLEVQLQALVQQTSVLAMVIQSACAPPPTVPPPVCTVSDESYYDEDLATVLYEFNQP